MTPDPSPFRRAWERFRAAEPQLFAGSVSDRYLENRLHAAFSAGWTEAADGRPVRHASREGKLERDRRLAKKTHGRERNESGTGRRHG